MRILYRVLSLIGVLVVLTVSAQAQAVVTEIRRVSVSSTGVEANNLSESPSISANGRFVVFSSDANNLTPDDPNNRTDTFLHDLQTGTTELISVSTTGEQGDLYQYSISQPLSDDGRYIIFTSQADNLVPDDLNGQYDLFLRDRQTGETTLLSLSNLNEQVNININSNARMSSDGRYVIFETLATNILAPNDSNTDTDIFLYDRQLDQTAIVSVSSAAVVGNGDSTFPQMSSDRRIITFSSVATNLVAGDTNGASDVFVRNLQTGQTSRINLTYNGTEPEVGAYGQVISADGRFVAYSSPSDELVLNDTNDVADVFVRNLQTAQTSRISISSSGAQGNGLSYVTSISEDGRFVVFESMASNLVTGDTNNAFDVFVHDRQTGETTRVSVSAGGAQGNDASREGIITPSGSYIVFYSLASNLVANDNNNNEDIFVVPFYNPPPQVALPAAAPGRNNFAGYSFTLSWNRVSWAVEYELQIDDTNTFVAPLSFSAILPGSSGETVVTSLDAGRYFWRIRGKNSNGTWGAWSAVESFTVEL